MLRSNLQAAAECVDMLVALRYNRERRANGPEYEHENDDDYDANDDLRRDLETKLLRYIEIQDDLP
eukprot:6331910-Amphidinium_carterae.1